MGIWRQIEEYLYLKKSKRKEKPDAYLKMMHGMNRISIIVFLIALILLIYRWFFKAH